MLNLVVAVLVALESGSIRGTVRAESSLEPIAGAIIALPEVRRSVIADAKGYFVLADVPAGRWRVEASAFGYAGSVVTVVMGESGTIQLDVELRVRPVALPRVQVQVNVVDSAVVVSAPASAGPPALRMDAPALRLQPGLAEPDVLRALQMLPSVQTISDFSSALYVRGGASDQNLITLDGIPLFNPYHVGGIFSAIGATAVSHVDVAAGALPARTAGDRLAGTVAIHTRDGGRDRTRVEGSLGLISTQATVDGSVMGGRAAFLLTGRHTYIDVASKVAKAAGIIKAPMPYGFSDLYAKLTYSISSLGILSLSGYTDREAFKSRDLDRSDGDGDMAFVWGSSMLAISLRQPITGSLMFHGRAGYTEFRGDFDTHQVAGQEDPEMHARSVMGDWIAAGDFVWYNRWNTTYFGVQVDRYAFTHAADIAGFLNDEFDDSSEYGAIPAPPIFSDFDRHERVTTIAPYIENEWQPTATLALRAGVRLFSAGTLGSEVLPRLGVQWTPSRRWVFSAGVGRYAQAMRSMRNDESAAASILAYDLITAQPQAAGSATSTDKVIALEWRGRNTTVRLDAYHKRQRGLVLPDASLDPQHDPVLITDKFRVGEGSARGAELMARSRVGSTDLTISYGLSTTKREVDGEVFTPRFARTHVFDASTNTPLGAAGILSLRAVWGTGQPVTPILGFTNAYLFDPATRGFRDGGGRIVYGAHNASRLPGYFRLDAAMRKTFDVRWFGHTGQFTPYLQVLNVLNTRNTMIFDSKPDERAEAPYLWQVPILPTLGFDWKF